MDGIEEKTIQALEFGKIVEMLTEQAATTLGKERCRRIRVETARETIELNLLRTEEARKVITVYGEIPLGGFHDVRESIKRASFGSILDTEELLDISSVLSVGSRIIKFMEEMKEELSIKEITQRVTPFPKLEKKIKQCIAINGEVADDASAELASIRKSIRTQHERIQERLASFLNSGAYSKYIQESIITMREDRYVIPIKVEHKNSFPGVIHDQSASGATVYIEPMAVVELNNKIKELKLKEKEEIYKILKELTNLVAQNSQAILDNIEAIGEIDFIFAKGKLSRVMEGIRPSINDEGKIRISNGRHPLLGEKAVPINVHLGRDFRILVVTGPNTGGKTVTLKSIGLFTLMVQAGLHIPAEEGTEISLFKKVFCDIGDEQSIEQNLSTFSSHMTNIVEILKKVDAKTLVLLDELGAGTDPAEGAGLAMAILEYLYHTNCCAVATTHYSELKTFAYTHPGIENACMQFDVETLSPTYKLCMGIPGRSNAFEIAQRLGLQEEIIVRAKKYLTQEDLQVEKLIAGMESTQRLLDKEREELEEELRKLEQYHRTLEKQMEKLKSEEQAILLKAKDKAMEILQKTEKQAEEALEEWKNRLKEEEERSLHKASLEFKEKLRMVRKGIGEKVPKGEKKDSKGSPPESLRLGETVYVVSLGQKGQVIKIEGKDVTVQIGIMKVNVKMDDLRMAENEVEKTQQQATRRMIVEKAKHIPVELDLRGMVVDEALQKVDKYLDDAYLANLPQVYIIHGKGTGALRQAITEMLKGHPHISSFRLGSYNEGGEGVTVVRFKAH